MSPEQPASPSERIQLPAPSWGPALLAIGVAVAVTGTFAGWPYVAGGAALALAGLIAWVGLASRELARLPRSQELTTAVIPPLPVRHDDGER